MDFSAIEGFLKREKQSAYRFNQIKKAYFTDLAGSWEEIFTLPRDLREGLARNCLFSSVQPEKLIVGKDKKTQKALLKLGDGTKIESVLMDYEGWLTACLSVMVGCPLGCLFCATGKMGFIRNLTAEEMVDQLVFWNRLLKPAGKRVNHLVFMGMGEPFLNWENFWEAIKIIQDKDGLNIGDRKISVSTAGIIEKIYYFTETKTQINLAISLHSPNQEKRAQLMPVAITNPLDKLVEACLTYVNKTKRKLFFEYALIADRNDTDQDALMLSRLMRKSYLFHLNLIQLNEVAGGLRPSLRENEFIKILDKNRVSYTLRKSFGSEVSAACGQLATSGR